MHGYEVLQRFKPMRGQRFEKICDFQSAGGSVPRHSVARFNPKLRISERCYSPDSKYSSHLKLQASLSLKLGPGVIALHECSNTAGETRLSYTTFHFVEVP